MIKKSPKPRKHNRRKTQGKIIPNGVSLEKHENNIVVVFTELGYDVELIPTARQRQVKTADAIIDGLEWEFKTPRGKTTRSIQHIIKKAVSQSPNVILDARLMDLPDDVILRKVQYEANHTRSLRRLKLILGEEVIDIK